MKTLTIGSVRSESWPSWDVYPVGVETINGIVCLVEDISRDPEKRDGLPLEFCLRELADVDIESEESIARFSSTWGIPHSPFQNSWEHCLDCRNPKSRFQNFIDQVKRSHRANDVVAAVVEHFAPQERALGALKSYHAGELYERLSSPLWWGVGRETAFWREEGFAIGESAYARLNRRKDESKGAVISLSEVKRAIVNLRELARVLAYLDRYEPDEVLARIEKDFLSGEQTFSPYIETIGEGVLVFEKLCGWASDANQYFAKCLWPILESAIQLEDPETGKNTGLFAADSQGRFSFMEAAALQMYYELDDGKPWKECAYEGCSRMFKFQRTDSRPVYLTDNKRAGTGYCCKSHAVMEARRVRGLKAQGGDVPVRPE